MQPDIFWICVGCVVIGEFIGIAATVLIMRHRFPRRAAEIIPFPQGGKDGNAV